MNLRSKLAFGLMVTVLVLALAPSSFAQVSLSVFPNANSAEVDTNHAAEINDPTQAGSAIQITGTQSAQVQLTATLFTINFGVPITSSATGPLYGCPQSAIAGQIPAFLYSAPNNAALATSPLCTTTAGIPVGDAIRIDSAAGIFATSTGVSIWTIDYVNGAITFVLPHTPAGNLGPAAGATGSFRVPGIRTDVSGKVGTTAALTATLGLGNSANNYIIGTASPITFLTSLAPGIASLLQKARSSTGIDTGTSTIFTNRNVPDGTATFTITEGANNAFLAQADFADGAVSNGHSILLTFTGVPAGVTLNLAISSGTPSIASISGSTITSTTNTRTVTFNTANVKTAIETVQVDITSITVSTSASLAPGTITVTATMTPNNTTQLDTTTNLAPNGTGIPVPTVSGGYPSFNVLNVGPLTVTNIVAANTTLLLPYVVKIAQFDTGIAVANTTADNFGATTGGATAGTGTIAIDFFPNATGGGAGTPFTLTTSTTIKPGAGLSSDGTLAAGATWTALLSEILTAAGKTGDFVGYAFIRTGFLAAHGTATISDFRTYSLAANVLVLPPPAISSRNSPTGGAEALNN